VRGPEASVDDLNGIRKEKNQVKNQKIRINPNFRRSEFEFFDFSTCTCNLHLSPILFYMLRAQPQDMALRGGFTAQASPIVVFVHLV
jgi:hypothetical protein